MTITRRDFAATLTATATLRAATPRNLKIGHTCITWGTFPRGAEAFATLEPAVRDIAALGYNGFETFPEVFEDWDQRGALQPLLEKYKLPVTSGYIRINVTDPTKKQESLDTVVRLGKVLKKLGGNFAPIQVNRGQCAPRPLVSRKSVGVAEFVMTCRHKGDLLTPAQFEVSDRNAI